MTTDIDTVIKTSARIIETVHKHLDEPECKHNIKEIMKEAFQ